MSSKVSALIEATTFAATDLFYSVVGGAHRKVKGESVFAVLTGSKHLFSYASLSAAVAAISTNQATLWITSSTTVAASLAIPSNITLIFMGTGMISVNSGQTLTLNTGNMGWPLRQIFTGTGSVRFGGNIEASYPQWFGAAMDGTTDDTIAIQKAIDVWNTDTSFRAASVHLVGAAVITSTLTITTSGIKLKGTGWGFIAGAKRGFLKWEGAAGTPLIKLQDCIASGVENIRLLGKTSAKPSAAIELNQTGGGGVLDQPVIRNVWIGPGLSGEADTGVQFSAGIQMTGNVNCDSGVFQNITIHGCTIGVDNQNVNASVLEFGTLVINACTTGFKTVAPHIIITNFLCSNNGIDMVLANSSGFAKLIIHNYVSEGSGRLATLAQNSMLVLKDGSFQTLTASFTPADTGNIRYLIDAQIDTGGTHIYLENFDLTSEVDMPLIPVIRQKVATPGSGYLSTIRLIQVSGITANNLDLGSAVWTNDSPRFIEFTKRSTSIGNTPVSSRMWLDWTRNEDNVFQDTRTDVLGKLNNFGGPLKVKPIAPPNGVGAIATGSGATSYSYKVTALTLDGETTPSSAATCLNAASLSSTVFNTITSHGVVGAYAYRLYGRTSGSELLIKTVTAADMGDTFLVTFVDDGAITPSGALPTKNTTARAYFGTPDATPDDAALSNGQITFYLDEANNKLKVRVKYSDGTLKTGEITLP